MQGCYRGCLHDPPSHTGFLAYPYCEEAKEPSCTAQLAFDRCANIDCRSPYHKGLNLTMGQRPIRVKNRQFAYFSIHIGNGSFSEAADLCSGWEEDAAAVMQLRDEEDFYQLLLRLMNRLGIKLLS